MEDFEKYTAPLCSNEENCPADFSIGSIVICQFIYARLTQSSREMCLLGVWNSMAARVYHNSSRGRLYKPILSAKAHRCHNFTPLARFTSRRVNVRASPVLWPPKKTRQFDDTHTHKHTQHSARTCVVCCALCLGLSAMNERVR